MKNKKAKTFLGIFMVILVCFGCSNQRLVDGGGTEGGNVEKVAGVLMASDGGFAANTQVALIPKQFNPIAGLSEGIVLDTTRDQGVYGFSHIDTGVYNIQAVDLNNKTRVFIREIHIAGHSVQIPLDTLKKTGTIRVQLGSEAVSTGGYIYIPGSTVVTSFMKNTGSVMLDSVPCGIFPSINYESGQGLDTPAVLAENIAVVSDSTTIIIPYEAWLYSKKLYLNTTASGAGVAQSVTGFPVLVRLSGTNFTFTEAKAGGEDIRFTNSDGTSLSYEIEQWDASGQQAAIWVNVDTVFGNDNSHFINMYWGNVSANQASNSAAVFDTANGFQGVWHMGQTGNSTAFDATANLYNGTPHNMNASSGVAGEIGGAQKFDGISSYFEMIGTSAGKLDFPQNGTYAISAWVLTDTFDLNYHTVAAKGDNQYDLEIIPSDEWEFAECNNGLGWDMVTTRSPQKTWTYLTGIRNGTKEYLYLNGVLADSTISLSAITALRNTDADIMIGRTKKPSDDTTGYYFKGMIDEVRITSVAPNPDWIKLCYMNQKANDALVVFKP